MAEQPANQNNSDEIDLGQLFQIIGRGFQKLFNFIGSIFKGLFHLLILFLLFIQKHVVILSVAVVAGGIGGYFLDNYLPQKYISKMVVEPNFNSVQQLYNNIDFYNDLAEANDSITLGNALGIESNEAASIREIFVDSYSDENQKIKLFDNFIKGLDTSTVKTIDFEAYIKNFNAMDARFHQISVISTNNLVAKETQPAIINSISANDYFKLQKEIDSVNINLQDSIYNAQLKEVNELQELYKTVLEKEAEKPMQGTNINLADNGESQNKELALIQQREVLKQRLVQLNQERANKSEILNVISDFPTRGVEQKGVLVSFKFMLPLILLGFVIAFLGILQLNRFLKEYHTD